MVFSSAIFLFIFLPAVFIIYRLLPGIKAKNVFLALSSIVFYAFGQLIYVPLFLGSVIVNYFFGLILSSSFSHRKFALISAVIINLGVLCIFKYTDFFIKNLNSILGTCITPPGIVLPIGISFFTFQGLSYVIDVYRDRDSGSKNFIKVLLYISFFPQLIAGPIVKYHDIAEQIDCRQCDSIETAAGIRRFVLGLAKKLIISNAAGYISDQVFNNYLHAAAGLDFRLAWLGGISYMLQIYYDFSGYSDMAIGMGHMFGFCFGENFRYPYSAGCITEFWRRWHISLSSWFKEYLYIPLGGNRKGKCRTALNKLIVFFCTGMWHGANWTFIIWGLGHGLLSSLESLNVIPVKKLNKSKAGKFVLRVYTLLFVMLLFVVFRADSLDDAGMVIASMFSFRLISSSSAVLTDLLSPAVCFILCTAILFSGKPGEKLRSAFENNENGNKSLIWQNSAALVLYILCMLCLARGGFNPFIYFQF